ncbi:unnamed protein product [Allacma fusca]|uniref:Uncharacterized protein n=1 Tax=Allacma fusca TaxID=39272 RepID=A0A8J2JCA9_9HEXA|nr:unnamed protein product [Allacma fusca]
MKMKRFLTERSPFQNLLEEMETALKFKKRFKKTACITKKIPIFQKSFMRGSGRKRRSHQNLTSTVFSERSATLIWLTMEAITIFLVSDGAFSLPELYSKFITDLHLTIAKVQEQAGVWDAEMGPRLQNAVKYCQHQQALLKKLEEVPFLITSPETYSFLELFLSIKSKLIHIVLPSLQSSDAAVTESTFESQDNSVFSSLDDIFEKWEDFLSSLKISRHRRVSPTNLSEELYKPRACTLVRIFSSPWFPHGL